MPVQDEPGEDPLRYTLRGDFLIGLAQEALEVTRRRKLEKEIAVIASALKEGADKPRNRRFQQLKDRLAKLKNELDNTA